MDSIPRRSKVHGGSFTVGKAGGTYAGADGVLAVHGTIILRVETARGVEALKGTFVMHGVTRG